MVIFLEIIVLYLLLPNILLLFLLRTNLLKSLDDRFSLLISYGSAPLISGLIFWILFWIVPGKSNFFYIAIAAIFWLLLFFYGRTRIKDFVSLYKNVALSFRGGVSAKRFVLYTILFLVTALYSIQAFIYPIADGDAAYYLLQGKAIHQTRDANWQTDAVLINNSVYNYSPMIQPGIPVSNYPTFVFERFDHDHLAFNFFFVYYYYLLLFALLLLVSKIALAAKKNPAISSLAAMFFYVFYWNHTRFYIFNNKEVAIFFFALLSIYLVYELIVLKKRSLPLEIILGAVLGFNSFINFHGMAIDILLLLILLIFSRLTIGQRLRQIILVFAVHLLFGAFEFFQLLNLAFGNTVRVWMGLNGAQQAVVADEVNKQQHVEMYQAKSFSSVYLRGKLQSLTSPGSYGFYVLFFLVTIGVKFKELFANTFTKIILAFTGLYYLVIIDPLNLNKNPIAVVLWGSPKYSMFVVLLSIVIVSVFFAPIIETLFNFILKKHWVFIACLLAAVAALLIFKTRVLDFGLDLLLKVIQVSRDISFYADKVLLFYYILLGFLLIITLILLAIKLTKFQAKAKELFLLLAILFMISPFFIVSPGKVPFKDTFKWLSVSTETKLKNVITFGELYEVYYYARENLPKGSIIATMYLELYPYNDDQLLLRGEGYKGSNYEIKKDCGSREVIYERKGYNLCKLPPIY